MSSMAHGETKQEWSRAHDMLRRSGRWANLLLDGYLVSAQGFVYESRRCPHCGSTISKRVSKAEALATLAELLGVHTRSLGVLAERVTAPARIFNA